MEASIRTITTRKTVTIIIIRNQVDIATIINRIITITIATIISKFRFRNSKAKVINRTIITTTTGLLIAILMHLVVSSITIKTKRKESLKRSKKPTGNSKTSL